MTQELKLTEKRRSGEGKREGGAGPGKARHGRTRSLLETQFFVLRKTGEGMQSSFTTTP